MLLICSIALLSLGIDLESSSMLLHIFSIFERIVLSAFSDRRLRGLVCAEGLKLGLVDQVHVAANICSTQLLYN